MRASFEDLEMPGTTESGLAVKAVNELEAVALNTIEASLEAKSIVKVSERLEDRHA